jgi:hypothetical protein
MTKLKNFFALTVIFFLITGLQAQYSREDAIHLILNQILTNDIGQINVYCSKDLLSVDDGLLTFDRNTIQFPFQTNWVFFVDDYPTANWNHPCRYIFVDGSSNFFTLLT